MGLMRATDIEGWWHACALRHAMTSDVASMIIKISWTARGSSGGPKMISKNTSFCYSIPNAASQPIIGATLCPWRREAVSTKVVRVLM